MASTRATIFRYDAVSNRRSSDAWCGKTKPSASIRTIEHIAVLPFKERQHGCDGAGTGRLPPSAHASLSTMSWRKSIDKPRAEGRYDR